MTYQYDGNKFYWKRGAKATLVYIGFSQMQPIEIGFQTSSEGAKEIVIGGGTISYAPHEGQAEADYNSAGGYEGFARAALMFGQANPPPGD